MFARLPRTNGMEDVLSRVYGPMAQTLRTPAPIRIGLQGTSEGVLVGFEGRLQRDGKRNVKNIIHDKANGVQESIVCQICQANGRESLLA